MFFILMVKSQLLTKLIEDFKQYLKSDNIDQQLFIPLIEKLSKHLKSYVIAFSAIQIMQLMLLLLLIFMVVTKK